MKVRVVYQPGGDIISLAAVTGDQEHDDSGRRAPRFAVQPGEGQLVSVIALDDELRELGLADLHRWCKVVGEGDDARLRRTARES